MRTIILGASRPLFEGTAVIGLVRIACYFERNMDWGLF